MGGGIKNIRALVLFKFSLREMMIQLHPKAVRTVKVTGKSIPDRLALTVMSFIFIYFMTTILFSFLLMASGMEFISAFTAVIACITNAGPGLGEIGPASSYAVLSGTQKWLCAAWKSLPSSSSSPLLTGRNKKCRLKTFQTGFQESLYMWKQVVC